MPARSRLLHEKSAIRVTMVQMPALNTPQFEMVKSKMRKRPQPIPPIFQPEVAADAIVFAATHHRREMFVGASAAGAILANRLAPALLDRYLARNGFKSQQTGEQFISTCSRRPRRSRDV